MHGGDGAWRSCDTLGFSAWLESRRLFHWNKQRSRTHLVMAVGTYKSRFLDVPQSLRGEFLRRYAVSGISGAASDEPKYLMEMPDPEAFRMYFDVDYVAEQAMPRPVAVELATLAQRLVSGRVFVTGCTSYVSAGRVKSGLHLKCPDRVVSNGEALELRRRLVEALRAYDRSVAWDAVVDDSVYHGGCGIRCLGSRKSTKGVDVGRVHRLLFVVNGDGAAAELPPMTALEQLEATSVFPPQ